MTEPLRLGCATHRRAVPVRATTRSSQVQPLEHQPQLAGVHQLFFKWIKQHLRIKAFFGTSANAVKTQIWIAISTYLLVAIARKRLGIERDLYTILQILSVHAFEKTPLAQVLSLGDYTSKDGDIRNQVSPFNI